ncbi:methyltransferase RsmF C-terminal domain-like protein [Panacibacter microcysteis]|nr:RNA methyltransferase [Panacibacter microcysteis]
MRSTHLYYGIFAAMLPVQLIQSLEGVKGFDKESFLRVHASGSQVTSVRLNPSKHVSGEWSMLNEEAVPWCEHGRYLKERPFFTHDPLLHGGAYYVQEASSMFLWTVLHQTVGNATQGLKVLDLCAAPGGKSTLLASYFTGGLLVSNEVIKSRASILVENLNKWGSDHVIVTNNDPKDFAALQNYFDVIIVDAPCSGSGLFRRDAEAINEWSEDNVALCCQRQQRILADVFPALKKDGILIYATCSYSAAEDENIGDFMCKTFEVESLPLKLHDDWNIVETISKHKSYGYRFYPDKVKGEGFFIAAFRKTDGVERSLKAATVLQVSKTEQAFTQAWLTKSPLFLFRQAENIIALPEVWKYDLAILQKQLYLRKAGVTVGALKGKDLVPDHELALSLLINANINVTGVNKETALSYLKRKDFRLENAPKGWNLLRYCGISIGWVKVLHNRINNYYPVNWRILKD